MRKQYTTVLTRILEREINRLEFLSRQAGALNAGNVADMVEGHPMANDVEYASVFFGKLAATAREALAEIREAGIVEPSSEVQLFLSMLQERDD